MKKYIVLFLTIGITLNVFAEEKECAIIDTLENGIIKTDEYEKLYYGAGKDYFIAQQKSNEKYGVININNNVIIPFSYDGIELIRGKYYKVKIGTERNSNNNVYGIMDFEGKIIVPLEYSPIVSLIYNGKIIFRVLSGDRERYGYIDEHGSVIVPIKYKEWNRIPNFWEMDCNRTGISNGKYGWIDVEGKEVIQCQYDAAQDFDSKMRLAPVAKKINGIYKWGIIDINGEIVLPLIYDYVRIYENICVTLNGRKFEVDKNGTKIRDIDF